MLVLEEENKLAERDRALEEIAARLGVRAERGRRFAELTSLRVGGAIDWVIAPETEEQAAAIVHELDQAGIGWRALGSGSNVLADDGDHHYVVLSLSNMKGEVASTVNWFRSAPVIRCRDFASTLRAEGCRALKDSAVFPELSAARFG